MQSDAAWTPRRRGHDPPPGGVGPVRVRAGPRPTGGIPPVSAGPANGPPDHGCRVGHVFDVPSAKSPLVRVPTATWLLSCETGSPCDPPGDRGFRFPLTRIRSRRAASRAATPGSFPWSTAVGPSPHQSTHCSKRRPDAVARRTHGGGEPDLGRSDSELSRDHPGMRVGPEDGDGPPTNPDLGREVARPEEPSDTAGLRIRRQRADDPQRPSYRRHFEEQPVTRRGDIDLDPFDRQCQVVGRDRQRDDRVSPAHGS